MNDRVNELGDFANQMEVDYEEEEKLDDGCSS